MDYTIRLVKKEDIPTLATIYKSYDEYWTQESAEMFFEWWFNLQQDLFFVATFESKPIGGIVASVKPWWKGKTLTDCELFVHSDYQKQGVGKKLLEKLIAEAIIKYKIIEFECLVDKIQEFPLNWYKKLGMTETSLVHIAGEPEEILKKLS